MSLSVFIEFIIYMMSLVVANVVGMLIRPYSNSLLLCRGALI
mgnify:CR=1 FL=1